MRGSSQRAGFTLVELSISMILISIMLLGSMKSMQSNKRTLQLYEEVDFARGFEEGVKNSFEEILDTFEPICSNIASDAQAGWGWSHARCSRTSLFPTFVSNDIISYALDLSNLTLNNRTNLVNSISGSLSPYCQLSVQGANSVSYRCANIRALSYDLGAGAVASAHTGGSDLNPLFPPQMTLTLERRDNDGVLRNQTYESSFLNVYQKRRSISNEKFGRMRNILKSYYDTRLTAEFANPPIGGLNSVDDEFIPWYWMALADNSTRINDSCIDVGGSCTNINSNNAWRNTIGGNALYMRRLSTNLFSGDTSLNVDGFGNQVVFYPTMSQCGANDISTCAVVALPLPQENYYLLSQPPYVSAFYINSFRDKSVASPSFGRIYVSY